MQNTVKSKEIQEKKTGNVLLKLKAEYTSGNLEKRDYMEKMYDYHKHLFEYRELLKQSLAKNVTITEDNVIVEMQDTGIKLCCVKEDREIIPLAELNFGKYEEKLWDKTFSLLPPPETVFDIGANIGYFSLYFSSKFPKTKIYAFEPIPNTFKHLNKNLEINNSKNITPLNIGLSDTKKTVEMFYNPEACGSSSLENLLENKSTYKVETQFNTLDDFVKENNIDNIDFIKCDVEGAEKFVYEGGLKTIEKFHPIIYSEMLRKWSAKFSYHPNDIIKIMKEFNYSCYAISDTTFDKITEVTDDTVETNFIFM